MGFKRTSKKTGATTRKTRTVNTNGNITNSSSTGNKYGRTTYSNSSKNGNKVTQTWRDGAGFTHRKTMYKSPTDAQRRREAKKAREFWSNLLGGSKAKPKKKANVASTPSSSGGGIWLIAAITVITLIVLQSK